MAIYYLIKLLRTNHWGNYGEEKGSFKKRNINMNPFMKSCTQIHPK